MTYRRTERLQQPDVEPAAAAVQGLSVWVTGASRGLGLALARGLVSAGARVAMTSRPGVELERAVDELRDAGGEVLALPASVADSDGVDAAAGAIAAAWGSLDGLVNAAGVSPAFVSAERLVLDDWHTVLDTNLTGSFLCARAAFSLMRERGGSIVNVSSVHGQVALARLSAYCASKGGVEMLTRALALDWSQFNIRVNALAPGYFETHLTQGLRDSDRWRTALLDKTPMGRFGQPDELVGATAFLLSPASGYVTGSTLVVDGGWTAT